MPIRTRCPYCRRAVTAPDRAFGASGKCPGCGNWYTIAPEPGVTAADPAHPREPEAPRPTDALEPAVESWGGPADPLPLTQWPATPASDPGALTRWPSVATGDPETRDAGKSIKAAGAIACLLAAGALVAASSDQTTWLTRVLGAAGVLVAIPATVVGLGSRFGVVAVPAAGAVLSTGILTASFTLPGLLGPRYEASRQSTTFDPGVIRPVPLGIGEGADAGLQADGWADAQRAAVEQGAIRVRVTGATIGRVELAGKPPAFTRESYLAVRFRVQHLGHGGPVTYTRWSGPGPRPRLDRGGRGFDPIDPGSREIRGQARSGVPLHPGHSIEDVLLFEAPGAVEPVRLALPAEAWGGQGPFQFHIPATLITTGAGLRPPPVQGGKR